MPGTLRGAGYRSDQRERRVRVPFAQQQGEMPVDIRQYAGGTQAVQCLPRRHGKDPKQASMSSMHRRGGLSK